MASTEEGYRWWVRYVIVPLIAGGGLLAWLLSGSQSSNELPANHESESQIQSNPTPVPEPSPRRDPIPLTYAFNMSQLDKLDGKDCEMDTDPQDTVNVNFSSTLKHTAREVILTVSFRAKEYKGNGTEIGKSMTEVIYKTPAGKHIADLNHRGRTRFSIDDFGAQGRNHGFRSFGDLIGGSYWDRLEYKVDDRGDNDCATAGVKGRVSFTVVLVDAA